MEDESQATFEEQEVAYTLGDLVADVQLMTDIRDLSQDEELTNGRS